MPLNGKDSVKENTQFSLPNAMRPAFICGAGAHAKAIRIGMEAVYS